VITNNEKLHMKGCRIWELLQLFLHVFLHSYETNAASEFVSKLQRQTQTETHNISFNILYFSLLNTAKYNCKNAQTVRLYV